MEVAIAIWGFWILCIMQSMALVMYCVLIYLLYLTLVLVIIELLSGCIIKLAIAIYDPCIIAKLKILHPWPCKTKHYSATISS